MSQARTEREAIAAAILADVDALLLRVEAMPATIGEAESRIAESVAALDAAGDRYRLAVTAYTEQAKQELQEYIARQVAAITARTVEEQRAAIQEAASLAMANALPPAPPRKEVKPATPWGALAATAITSASVAALLAILLAKHL